MPTAEKAQTIEQAKQWYDKSVGVVFTDFRGLKVKEIQALRKQVKSKGGEIHVIKNTLFRLAAGSETVDSLPAEFHNGTTAFAFVYENESDVAKTLVDYARTSRKLQIKGGYFAGKTFNSKEIEALAELPPRDVLIAQVIGAIISPLTNLVGVIEALYADPIRVIGAVADKVAENSPLPNAATQTVETSPPVDETPAENSKEVEAEPSSDDSPTETTDASEPDAKSEE